MEGTYPIYLGGQAVGQAKVRQEGLYLHFSCRCRFGGETIYKLMVTCGDHTENLGIPIPDGAQFCLETKIPVKRLGEGKLAFCAVPKRGELTGRFIPLSPEEPFAYLTRLKNAFLEVRTGRVGVVIPYGEDDDV